MPPPLAQTNYLHLCQVVGMLLAPTVGPIWPPYRYQQPRQEDQQHTSSINLPRIRSTQSHLLILRPPIYHRLNLMPISEGAIYPTGLHHLHHPLHIPLHHTLMTNDQSMLPRGDSVMSTLQRIEVNDRAYRQ